MRLFQRGPPNLGACVASHMCPEYAEPHTNFYTDIYDTYTQIPPLCIIITVAEYVFIGVLLEFRALH